MEWLELARKLPEGGQQRWRHCGSDEAAVYFHSTDGYSFYCHRCGEKDFESHGYRNYKELLEVKARNEEAKIMLQQAKLALPKNFSHHIPAEGMLWLLKASITPHMAKEAGFGWDSYFKRVILPVYNDSTLVYYQARAVLQGQDPKYLNPRVDKRSIMYQCKHATGVNRVVVTEDILSARRVFLATNADTAALLGTKISIQQANKLSEYHEVITWFDSDSAGVTCAGKVQRLVGLTANVRNVVTHLDPKLLTDRQIQELICNNMHSK